MVELTGKSNGTLAQVVEQWTENPCVLGSTPRGTTQQCPAHPSGALLLIPIACSFFGIGNDVAMQAVAVGVSIGSSKTPSKPSSTAAAMFSSPLQQEFDRKQNLTSLGNFDCQFANDYHSKATEMQMNFFVIVYYDAYFADALCWFEFL